jgi:hypothetical protein
MKIDLRMKRAGLLQTFIYDRDGSQLMQMNKKYTWKRFQKVGENLSKDELIIQSMYCLFKTCWKNDLVQLHLHVFKNVRKFPKKQMHIFDVSVTTVLNLENVSLEMWEEFITQSRYRLFKTCWKKLLSSTTCNFFLEKMSEHFQNVTCSISMCSSYLCKV